MDAYIENRYTKHIATVNYSNLKHVMGFRNYDKMNKQRIVIFKNKAACPMF